MRKCLATEWLQDDSLIQLGGKQGGSTDVAHHFMHAHLSWAKATCTSCALLFVDLQAAFYSVLRTTLVEDKLHEDLICHAMQVLGITPQEWHLIIDTAVHDHATRGLPALMLMGFSRTCSPAPTFSCMILQVPL